MQVKTIDVPMRTAAENLTVKIRVRGLRVFKVRLWLGLAFFRTGAWVIGLPVEIETISRGEDDQA